MSQTITCDWCGDSILESRASERCDAWVTIQLETAGNAKKKYRRWTSGGYVGHYHEDCWGNVDDALDLIHAHAPVLASVRVASDREIERKRQAHVLAGEESLPDLPISELYIRRTRTYNLLDRHGVRGLRALKRVVHDRSILDWNGVGPTILAELEDALTRALDEVAA
jgi:hypothetical protein